ncbi:hypothetical protein LIS90_13515 [Flavobacterium psychrophilum]|uniref:Uncharacterized protein n=1 Tax=Flavobacterium psychrophilum TaxID=96345 RepID=A0A7U2NF54_FLAPS|nr:hypothetical protein [Flavobacterium psychrophilum]EKT3958579.1 hypothetical protein [Flavobacterium psychrophilum]EKT4510575.1 hypothetical protein [Flavobacterium psychrophilum]ELM3645201.1 hypothetical protein [Flavobacterium psychrophilum]MCB6089677.1 hypothetical protein [Flavobacterium psychrophilum]MCB6232264.1 hypothetical protein [Flavobacterium psychrophilum]
MFKYKFTPIIFLVALFVIVIIYLLSGKEIEKENKLLKNGVHFSGEITEIDQSNNHDFGIIRVKIIESSIKRFKSKTANTNFPYTISGNVAEIYNYIPIEIKKGDKIFLNSNEKTISFFDDNKVLVKAEIYIIKEKIDLEFIKNKTEIQ